MKKSIFIGSVLAVALLFFAQKATAQESVWKYVTEQQMPRNDDYRTVHPKKYLTYQLDIAALKSLLSKAPMEFTKEAKTNPLILNIPMPDGKMQRFSVVESPMLEPKLAEKYPEIKTYSGVSVNNPAVTIGFDWNYLGFHAMILMPEQAPIQIDPYFKNNEKFYIVYSIADQPKIPYDEKHDEMDEHVQNTAKKILARGVAGTVCLGDTLREYRIAIACTNQYATRVGGTPVTKARVTSAIETSIRRVNQIYEVELSVRFRLIGSNDTIEFIDAATDPLTLANNGTNVLNRTQAVIDSLIPNADYDIGHIFTTAAGGVASLGVVCTTGRKARGATGQANPVGDTFNIGFVCHEIGHQFGANHTFSTDSGACGGADQYNQASSVEPGSGVTIMSYQGLCRTNNIVNHLLNLPNFHAYSLDEIGRFILAGGNSCPRKTTTGNRKPVVDAGTNQTVPISTPFTLTGSATDADGDALVYSWEEMDASAAPVDAGTGSKPFFRSFAPCINCSTRTFPQKSDIANNRTTLGEQLPPAAETLNFRLTARDNKTGGGATCNDNITVTFAGAAPFRVTSQPTATNWTGNGVNTAIITWDVAGTNAAPFNCDSVQIYLSTDSGYTFPTFIKTARNTGTDTIVIPSMATTRGRIMVRGKGKIFYNINRGNITINVCPMPAVFIRISDTLVCANKKVTFTANGSNITANPIYQWKKNGNNVGGNASAYIDSTLANGDSVWVTVTSNETCKITTAAVSNKIKVKVRTARPVAMACPLNATLCVGDTIRFSASPSGGVWSQMGRVTIDAASGLMTGTSAGTTTIKYTITDTGCSNTGSCNLTVVAALATPTIKYASGTSSPQGSGGLCTNKTFTLIGTPTGGAWSSTGAISITNAGVVTTTTATGASSVTYTIGTGNCKVSRTISMAVVACASRGISSTNKANSYVLYPNPAHGFVNLQMDKLISGTIVITDLYGKELRQQVINSKLQRLNVEGLAKGLYSITIVTNENRVTEKLLIE